MNELIELNETEQFLQDSGVRVTLKQVADKYGKEHFNLMNDFKRMITSLTDLELATLNFQDRKFKTVEGNLYFTFELDLKSLVWFVTKFDHSKRLQVVNFAFEKLKEEKDALILENVKEVEKITLASKKPIVFSDGRMSVRGCHQENWKDAEQDGIPNEADIWRSLVWKSLIVTHAKATISRTIPADMEGFIGVSNKRSTPTFLPQDIKRVWEQYVEAGKPVESESVRLMEEFEAISLEYKERIRLAKEREATNG